MPYTSNPDPQGSDTTSTCTAVILWQPRYVFFPPVQDRPPPKSVFRHIDLDQERDVEEVKSDRPHLPHHQDRCPDIFLNDTFVRFLFNPPKEIPNYPFPTEEEEEDEEEEENTYQDEEARRTLAYQYQPEDIYQEEQEQESSLESIDETPLYTDNEYIFPIPRSQSQFRSHPADYTHSPSSPTLPSQTYTRLSPPPSQNYVYDTESEQQPYYYQNHTQDCIPYSFSADQDFFQNQEEQEQVDPISDTVPFQVDYQLGPHSFDDDSSTRPQARLTKVVLKRKSPEFDRYIQEEQEEYEKAKRAKLHNYDVDHDHAVRAEVEAATEASAAYDQWRVGKRPGHQGSHSKFQSPAKVGEQESEEEKSSSLGKRKYHSIYRTAEKVLKMPFKPPTRIHAPTASTRNDKPRSRSQERRSSSPLADVPATAQSDTKLSGTLTRHSAPANLRGPAATGGSSVDPTFPSFTTTPHKSKSKSKAASFKTPEPVRTDRSSAPTPSTAATASRIRTNSTAKNFGTGEISSFQLLAPARTQSPSQVRQSQIRNNQATIASLEREILTHKQAIKYVAECDEEHLKGLIVQWRAAGREVVERLFGLVPCPTSADGSNSQADAAGYGSYDYGLSAGSAYGAASGLPQWTEEQREYLRRAPTNRDGDPVDEEGNLLIPDVASGDLGTLMGEGGGYGAYSGQSYASTFNGNNYNPGDTYTYTDTARTDLADPTSKEWNYGTLISALDVDPTLLGWDEKTEDWIDLDYTVSQESLD